MQSSTTPDQRTPHEKVIKKLHIQESQEVSHFPAGDHKAAINRQDNMTNTKILNKKDP